MSGMQKYSGGLSARETKRRNRAQDIRRMVYLGSIHEIDDRVGIEAHKVIRHTQLGQAKISGVMDLASHAASAWTGFSVKMDLHTQMSAGALPGLSVIMQRTLIEIDEALDDCTHKITGRGQI